MQMEPVRLLRSIDKLNFIGHNPPHMRYIEYKPCATLAQHLECIWFVSDEHTSETRPPEKVLPDACLEWIVHLGLPFKGLSPNGRWEQQPRSFVVGELSKFLMLQPGSSLATMGVRFRPASAYRFLPLPLDQLTDSAVPTYHIWGSEADVIGDKLLAARSELERKTLVETFLLGQLRNTSVRPRLEAAITEIIRCQGQVRVSHLAESLGTSRRQLEREFRFSVGLSPKSFARTIRFQNLLRLVGESTLREWASLALASGYSDQAHMVREYREFSGHTPTAQPSERLGDLGSHFIAPERLAALLGI